MNTFEVLTIVNSVLILYLVVWKQFYPNNRNLRAAVQELEIAFEDMNVSFQAAIDDIYDLIDNYLKKWSNRETTRAVRNSEKDLKEREDLSKRSGIIPLSELQKIKHGTFEQGTRRLGTGKK